MLVLSRKIGEKIHVGNDITIEVRRVAGNRVTLAVDAPRNVRILRGELRDAALEFELPEEEAGIEQESLRPTVVVTHQRLGMGASMPHVLG
jgi:carbon storage regulator CsrA